MIKTTTTETQILLTSLPQTVELSHGALQSFVSQFSVFCDCIFQQKLIHNTYLDLPGLHLSGPLA